ncbi:serine O-acetyltransferase [Furfurilactobacillus milii]|uniref:Serine acetyltransferase n=1 Tax=Furfurilactobacillus milii TaxID=2888272 RepID=A0ABT6DCB1_9LACO|nr:serine O-acetyltransferase [Furfurilactobacillus milii]QLE65659.1 Serine acetyltransferase [Furfurilactobacillus rossiae]MCF6161861.1 serine O-acetyltransferase [Furfurilactobacillus milii]MCF6164241.1 serine O-acetyltransferase [Furfurilactobacillus milii]MDF9914783.1 serine O-acetyltransferase [Furfurilactobacillus milii]QLE68089.1 Serine acetyltransferase [Furfurilactobacillus rossiae]
MFKTVDRIIKEDPAARTRWQVMLTYSGYQALVGYRLAHWLWGRQHLLLAELISHWTRHHTGVDIYPAATIGERLFIDHGIGVVIGATAVIGDDVTMLHGVTLGSRHDQSGKRHPSIGNHVLLGANAMLLGDITVHDFAKVGAGAVVLHDVGTGSTVAGNPAKVVRTWHPNEPVMHLEDTQTNTKVGHQHD